jgi:hypothetical protein
MPNNNAAKKQATTNGIWKESSSLCLTAVEMRFAGSGRVRSPSLSTRFLYLSQSASVRLCTYMYVIGWMIASLLGQ